jgi:cobalt-zinc-cadmium efflux system outer membrane protein
MPWMIDFQENYMDRRILLSALLALPLAGCATVPRQAGFGDVQSRVSQRTGHMVQWRGRSADDRAVDSAVDRLLAHPLTLDAAVQVALLNNLHLQSTYQELGIAQADLVQAGLLGNPVFSVERRFPGQALEIDVAGSFLDLFAMPLRKKTAASAFEAEKSRVADAVLKTAAEVRSAYFIYQGDLQLLEMHQSISAAAQAAYDAARRIRAAGNSNELDLASQQSLALQAEVDLSAAQAQSVQDRERLNELMGLWGGRLNWSIPQRLAELPPSDPAPQQLQEQAIRRRLDLAAARQKIETAARSLGYTKTFRFVPDVGLGLHYEHDVDPSHSIGPALDLPIPIFDQGQAKVARGAAVLEQKRFEYQAMAVDIRSQVRAAYARMSAARQQAQRYRDVILPLQETIVRRSQLQYNGMFVSVFQLLQAKRAQIEAGQRYIEHLRDYWIARSDLERAIGGRLGEGSPATRPATRPAEPEPKMMNHRHMHGM